ncbi:MAG: 50S ribosomal protein L9 [Vicingus serpentipes]|nr:50S ribosomal protein L9 [Vicingus serpentipes]
MKIILKENIENLGFKDEIVEVKNGYGRNFLIPRGVASLATKSAVKVLEENLKQRAVKDAKTKDAALKTAAALNEMVVKVEAKAGEKGKIFGSINTIQIAEAVEKLGHTVDRKYIKIRGEQIKSLGNYEADVRLHKDVAATIKFEVVAEK